MVASTAAALDNNDDDDHDVIPIIEEGDNASTTKDEFQRISVEEYLQNVIKAVDDSYRMTVTEQHRKKMIRCLMGYTTGNNSDNNNNTNNAKVEFDLKLQNVHLKEQWDKTIQFFPSLIDLQVDETKAPKFRQGIQLGLQMQQQQQQPSTSSSSFPSTTTTSCNGTSDNITFPSFGYQPITSNQIQGSSPRRFFSFLANGRTYKGKLQLLLQDVAPHLLPTFLDIIREPNELDLIRKLVLQEEQEETTDPDTINNNKQWRDQLLELLEKDFGNKGPNQPEDGGKGVGRRGEVDLISYLKQQQQQQQQQQSQDGRSTSMVLSNVYIKPPAKHLRNINQYNNPNKQIPHVILSQIQLLGMTSEFDALVVMKQQQQEQEEAKEEEVRILELWEAKASLHPISIYDVLFKKVTALEMVLADPDARMYFYPSRNPEARRVLCGGGRGNNNNTPPPLPEDEPLIYPLASSSSNNNNTESSPSTTASTTGIQIGMFGIDLMDPRSAARRTQFVACESLLEKSPQAVMEALDTGKVSPPDVMPKLEQILEEAKRLQPVVLVVPTSSSYVQYMQKCDQQVGNNNED